MRSNFKNFIAGLIISLLFPILSYSQNEASPNKEEPKSYDESKLYENALFQVTKKGETAYTTTINAIDEPFSRTNFEIIKSKMLQKKGIFKVDLLEENKQIQVYHLSYIELEAIKYFVLPYYTNFEFKNREQFIMN